jgi:fatty acid desaturase
VKPADPAARSRADRTADPQGEAASQDIEELSSAREFDEDRPKNRKLPVISWYRTPVDPKVLRELSRRSDWKGLVQVFSYLGILIITGTSAFYSIHHFPVWVTLLLFFLHGTGCSFMAAAAVHEMQHGTVFRSAFLNYFFLRFFAFFSWSNFYFGQPSHARHHRFTLHPPDDMEGMNNITWKAFRRIAIAYPLGAWRAVRNTWGLARKGTDKGWDAWGMTLLPEAKDRRRTVRWAWTLLIGHGLILVVSLYFHLWAIPILTSFCTFYGGWLMTLCAAPQHYGLPDHVSDFRICTRTYTTNLLCRILYWHMNYHLDHHMYPSVPCYNLKKLHEAIKHDLPHCPDGLFATWVEMIAIMKKTSRDATYRKQVLLSAPAGF